MQGPAPSRFDLSTMQNGSAYAASPFTLQATGQQFLPPPNSQPSQYPMYARGLETAPNFCPTTVHPISMSNMQPGSAQSATAAKPPSSLLNMPAQFTPNSPDTAPAFSTGVPTVGELNQQLACIE